MKWNDIYKDEKYPEHNQLVFIESKHGDYHTAIYKDFIDPEDGKRYAFFVEMPMAVWSAGWHTDKDNWMKNFHKWDVCGVDQWIAFREIGPDNQIRVMDGIK